MKQSKFTTVLPINDESTEFVIHNTLTNALATLTYEKHEIYKRILEGKDDEAPEDLLRQFISGGFIVDDNMDEMVNYEFHHLSDRFNSSALILTIAPSLECQFGCPYCYESGVNNNARMNESTQNAIINFIRRKNPRELIIHWYGGEPLLQMDIIENMTKRILLYCEENATHYDAEIITTGYLMDEAMLNRMLHCRIAKAQITIDGAKETHDSRRYLIGGGPTYETIMSNLENAAGRIKINLRVNVDKTNEKQIDELGVELANKNILDNVHAYLGHVTSTEEYESDFCISRQRYSELEDEWYEKLSQYSKSKKYTKLYHYPTQTMCRCIVSVKRLS